MRRSPLVLPGRRSSRPTALAAPNPPAQAIAACRGDGRASAGRCRTAAPARRRRPCRRACEAHRRVARGSDRRAPSQPPPSGAPSRARPLDRRPARSSAHPRGASAWERAPDRWPSIYIYLLNSRMSMQYLSRMAPPPLARRLLAELLGSAFLAALVVGSGIAAQTLSPGDTGLQLFENAAATAAGLFAVILMFGPASGGHFNPVVSLADATFDGLRWRDASAYIPAQISGCVAGAV